MPFFMAKLTVTPSEKSGRPKLPEPAKIRFRRVEASSTEKMSSWEDFPAQIRPFSTPGVLDRV